MCKLGVVNKNWCVYKLMLVIFCVHIFFCSINYVGHFMLYISTKLVITTERSK